MYAVAGVAVVVLATAGSAAAGAPKLQPQFWTTDGPVYAVAWHPDGKLIASAGFDGVVWIHDAATGKLVEKFTVMPKN